MDRRTGCLLAVALCCVAQSQIPDVSLVTDLRYSISDHAGKTRFRLYDPFARMSTISLQTLLENGLIARVEQRFVQVRADSASSSLERASIEAPGLWEIGLVPIPFGRKEWIRDYGTGAKMTSVLILNALPFEVAVVDSGRRRLRGVSVRLGDKIGLSYASGDHFGANAGNLAYIRDPERSPGLDGGYQTVLGADFYVQRGNWQVTGEFISLRRPETASDLREDWVDVAATLFGRDEMTFATIGYSRGLLGRTNAYRLDLSATIHPKAAVFLIAKSVGKSRVLAVGTRLRF